MFRVVLGLLSALVLVSGDAFAQQKKYRNETYGFEVTVPEEWQVYTDTIDADTKRAIIDWGLPKVYSELERTEIQNGVSITAYKQEDIKNINDLMAFEMKRLEQIMLTKEMIGQNLAPTYIILSYVGGMKYKSKVIFAYRNNIGYIINYTATVGSFDAHIKAFNDLVDNLVFTEPTETVRATKKSTQVRFDGLYVTKTGEQTVADNIVGIYTYIRFYKDGMAYTQSVNSYNPEKIAIWFGKYGRFEKSGQYATNDQGISFKLNNIGSPEIKTEGPETDVFKGYIGDDGRLFLRITYDEGNTKEFWFDFVSVD